MSPTEEIDTQIIERATYLDLLIWELKEYFKETREKYKMADNAPFGVDRMNRLEHIIKNVP